MQVFGFGAGRSGGAPSGTLHIGSVSDLAGAGTAGGRYGLAYDRDTMMCVGRADGSVVACQGDSGGPLTAWGATRTLVGVVSWGDGYGRAGSPGIYTRVSHYATWIQSQTGIAPNNSRISAYSPAQLLSNVPCKGSTCKSKKGKKLKSSVRRGSVAKVSSKTVKLTAKGSRKAQTKVKIKAGGQMLTKFKVEYNR